MKTAVAPTKVELSKAAVSLINEIWEHMILLKGREITPDELRAETPMGELTMAEYEFSLRQKLLKLRTAWQKSPSTEAVKKAADGGEGSYEG
jgi:hypothetical protein